MKTQLARTIEFLSCEFLTLAAQMMNCLNDIWIYYPVAKFPDASKAMDELQKFAKLNDRRLCKILRVLSDPQTELKLLIKTYVCETLCVVIPFTHLPSCVCLAWRALSRSKNSIVKSKRSQRHWPRR